LFFPSIDSLPAFYIRISWLTTKLNQKELDYLKHDINNLSTYFQLSESQNKEEKNIDQQTSNEKAMPNPISVDFVYDGTLSRCSPCSGEPVCLTGFQPIHILLEKTGLVEGTVSGSQRKLR
jgi:hypothetical protein